MAKVDLETWVLEVIGYVKANLNAKITAISTEKADGVALGLVDAAAFYYQDWGTAFPNHSPAVLFAINNETVETLGPESSEVLRIVVELYTSDQTNAGDDKIMKMIMRYKRAIREVFIDKFQELRGLKLVNLPEVSLGEHTGSNHYVVGVGVEIPFVY